MQPLFVLRQSLIFTVSPSLQEIETELKKRTKFKYKWGRVQNNYDDDLTKFIYATRTFDDVINEVKSRFGHRIDYKQLGDYTVNRWYNFWSAEALEFIFAQHPKVKRAIAKDKFCDFFVDGVPFDLKTTVFPKSVRFHFRYAKAHPEKLALWFYEHQSGEQRQHFHNRLFLVLHKAFDPSLSWTLKAEISWLEQLINGYLDNFDAAKLMELQLADHRFRSDIIWGIQ